jgi:hypothetical protein
MALLTALGEGASGPLAVEKLAPSEDFMNLVSEDMAPERYGRTPELDTQDRMMWSEMIWLRRRMQVLAVLRYSLAALVALLLVIGTVIFGVGALLRIL